MDPDPDAIETYWKNGFLSNSKLLVQEHEVGQACKVLLLALCDNLRIGKKESEELVLQLHSNLGYHDLGKEELVLQLHSNLGYHDLGINLNLTSLVILVRFPCNVNESEY